jgi:hypothetical protein
MSQLHPHPHARHTTSSPSTAAQQDELDPSWFSAGYRAPSDNAFEYPSLVSPADSTENASPKHRKKKKAKERIALDSNQPPTTQGKPRQRVFLACLQW